jgi:hypothetical protein
MTDCTQGQSRQLGQRLASVDFPPPAESGIQPVACASVARALQPKLLSVDDRIAGNRKIRFRFAFGPTLVV